MYGAFLGLILGVMAFDFTNNSSRLTVPGKVFVESMTIVRSQPKMGVLLMFVVTLGVGLAVILAELRRDGKLPKSDQLLPALGVMASIAIFIWVSFGTFIAGQLVAFVTTQANSVDTILGIADQLSAFPGYVYLLIAFVMILSAAMLRRESALQPAKSVANASSIGVGIVVGLAALITINTSNLQPIAADIVYKQANPWDGQGGQVLQAGTNVQGWDLAIEHYRRAIALAPNEDFYYLWLGRALLEKAKTTQATPAAPIIKNEDSFNRVIGDAWGRTTANPLPSANLGREDLLAAAKIILQEARVINPLNTDHSANLARMYRQSGDITQDPAGKKQRYESSSKEYAVATSLSTQNAQLLNEWGTLYFYGLGDAKTSMEKLNQSAKLDPKFDQTFLIRGDVQLQQANALDAPRTKAVADLAAIPVTNTTAYVAAQKVVSETTLAWQNQLIKAQSEFSATVKLNPNSTQALTVLADIALKLGNPLEAIANLEKIATIAPTDWNTQKNLALLYRDNKQLDKAKLAAQQALNLAPQDQQAAMQTLLQQLNAGQ